MESGPSVAPPTRTRKKTSRGIRRIVESRRIRRLSESQYRQRVQHMYDGPAGAALRLGSLLSMHEPLVGRMLKHGGFDVTRFRSILDIGSGAGQILGHLLKLAHTDTELVACDLSHNMLRRARQRVNSRRPLYVAADMTRLPFADESFDCVTCGWVLEHLADPRPGLAELARVLTPGGSLLLLATEDTGLGAIVSRTWQCRTYNRVELKKACNDVGLPWHEQLWFTPLHKLFKMGGILVEARKPAA